jgi:hypothetical protein
MHEVNRKSIREVDSDFLPRMREKLFFKTTRKSSQGEDSTQTQTQTGGGCVCASGFLSFGSSKKGRECVLDEAKRWGGGEGGEKVCVDDDLVF